MDAPDHPRLVPCVYFDSKELIELNITQESIQATIDYEFEGKNPKKTIQKGFTSLSKNTVMHPVRDRLVGDASMGDVANWHRRLLILTVDWLLDDTSCWLYEFVKENFTRGRISAFNLFLGHGPDSPHWETYMFYKRPINKE